MGENLVNLNGETTGSNPDGPWRLSSSVSYNWVDVTADMKNACQNLELGELVHELNFGLFDAMSAIEMMDPKMDSGMVGKQTLRKVLGFVESITGEVIKVSDLSYSELIGITDQLICCLLSWLDGQTLAQTVFTCLYLHDPNLIEDRCLRAYALCMLKVCDNIKENVTKANVFEEEDFQTLSYGFKFAENLTETRVLGMMKEIEEEYGRKYRNLKSKSTEDDQCVGSEAILCNAVLARIRFMKLLLQTLLAFRNKGKESPQTLKKHLRGMLEHLDTIGSTTELGIEAIDSDDGHSIVHGFEPLVNQKLLPPTFPRFTTLKRRGDIKDSFSEIINQFIMVSEVSVVTGFHNILEFFKSFAQSIPCVLSRSLLQLTFLSSGKQPVIDDVKESMRLFNAPPVFSARCPKLQNNQAAKSCANVFLSKAARVATTMVQTYGHNRARHRERLAALLEDLAVLQDESERADSQLHTIYTNGNPASENSHITGLSGWTTYYTLKMMIEYLYSGFELELYSPHEMHYIYWYLSEVLYAWLGTILNRAEMSLAQDEALTDFHAKTKSGKRAKRNKRKCRIHVEELRLLQGYQNMASGLFKAILGFFMGKKVETPNFYLDSECTRYEHRFLPFVNISTPPFMGYNHFQEMTDLSHYQPKPTAEQLYNAASKHFFQAKLFYETVANPTDKMQSFGKVAKTNLIVMKLLATGHKRDSTNKIQFDFSTNVYFPIFKIT